MKKEEIIAIINDIDYSFSTYYNGVSLRKYKTSSVLRMYKKQELEDLLDTYLEHIHSDTVADIDLVNNNMYWKTEKQCEEDKITDIEQLSLDELIAQQDQDIQKDKITFTTEYPDKRKYYETIANNLNQQIEQQGLYLLAGEPVIALETLFNSPSTKILDNNLSALEGRLNGIRNEINNEIPQQDRGSYFSMVGKINWIATLTYLYLTDTKLEIHERNRTDKQDIFCMDIYTDYTYNNNPVLFDQGICNSDNNQSIYPEYNNRKLHRDNTLDNIATWEDEYNNKREYYGVLTDYTVYNNRMDRVDELMEWARVNIKTTKQAHSFLSNLTKRYKQGLSECYTKYTDIINNQEVIINRVDYDKLYLTKQQYTYLKDYIKENWKAEVINTNWNEYNERKQKLIEFINNRVMNDNGKKLFLKTLRERIYSSFQRVEEKEGIINYNNIYLYWKDYHMFKNMLNK